MLIIKPTADFNAPQAGGVSSVKLELSARSIVGIALQVIGSGPLSAELDVANVIDEITLDQDTKTKIRIKPGLQRKLDTVLNSTDDVLSPSFAYVPLMRAGVPGSAWGTADIAQMLLNVKVKATLPSGGTCAFTAIKGIMGYIPTNTPVNRGSQYVQTVIPGYNPIAGWNTISDLPYQGIVSLTRMLFDANAITAVKVSIGERLIYDLTKAQAAFGLQTNELYKCPSSMPFFPVMLDMLGNPKEFPPLFENGIRQTVRVEYFWDTTITADPVSFDILCEGIERGEQVAVATGKA